MADYITAKEGVTLGAIIDRNSGVVWQVSGGKLSNEDGAKFANAVRTWDDSNLVIKGQHYKFEEHNSSGMNSFYYNGTSGVHFCVSKRNIAVGFYNSSDKSYECNSAVQNVANYMNEKNF